MYVHVHDPSQHLVYMSTVAPNTLQLTGYYASWCRVKWQRLRLPLALPTAFTFCQQWRNSKTSSQMNAHDGNILCSMVCPENCGPPLKTGWWRMMLKSITTWDLQQVTLCIYSSAKGGLSPGTLVLHGPQVSLWYHGLQHQHCIINFLLWRHIVNNRTTTCTCTHLTYHLRFLWHLSIVVMLYVHVSFKARPNFPKDWHVLFSTSATMQVLSCCVAPCVLRLVETAHQGWLWSDSIWKWWLICYASIQLWIACMLKYSLVPRRGRVTCLLVHPSQGFTYL